MVYYITRAIFAQGEVEEDRGLPGLGRLGIGAPELTGVFAALVFGYSYTLWAWTVVSKFYTLNAFVATCMVYLLLKWRRKVSDGDDSLRYLYFFVFLAGLGVAVHISQWPLYIAYGIFILLVTFMSSAQKTPDGKREFKTPAWMSYRLIFLLPVLFILGHSVYLYLPVRAMQDPLINWGDPDTVSQFKWMYNREGYPPVGGGRSVGLFFKQLKSFDLIREFGWAGILLIAGGIVAHFRKDRINAFLLVLATGGLASAVIIMGNPPEPNIFLLEQFYIPSYALLSVIIGGALYEVIKREVLAPFLLALAVPFTLLGNVPLDYLKNVFSGHRGMVDKFFLMGSEYPPYVYFVLYAVMAALLFALFMYIFSKKRDTKPLIVLLSVMVLFMLYPLRQIITNYHKCDRYENFVAFDMANAELSFAPEQSVLFTWGDSGAFPMWYLQFVEQKRPDVLLVHTPHLNLEWFLYSIMRTDPVLGDREVLKEDYGMLRNYNGIKGVRQMLMTPDYMREPSVMIRKIIQYNPERPYAWDYSSRYSIYNPRGGMKPPWDLKPYGITYMKPDDNYGAENARIWSYLVTRGLPRPKLALDLDETKAVSIYGFVHLDMGNWYLKTGYEPLAKREFSLAVAYAPELWPQLRPYLSDPAPARPSGATPHKGVKGTAGRKHH